MLGDRECHLRLRCLCLPALSAPSSLHLPHPIHCPTLGGKHTMSMQLMKPLLVQPPSELLLGHSA